MVRSSVWEMEEHKPGNVQIANTQLFRHNNRMRKMFIQSEEVQQMQDPTRCLCTKMCTDIFCVITLTQGSDTRSHEIKIIVEITISCEH